MSIYAEMIQPMDPGHRVHLRITQVHQGWHGGSVRTKMTLHKKECEDLASYLRAFLDEAPPEENEK